ncbi:MAG: imidazolonepropionase [Saprospiraceae bacterium]
MSTAARHLIGPFRQLVTMNGLPLAGPLSDADSEVISEAGLVIQGEHIIEVGAFATFRKRHPGAALHELQSDFVGLPGWVDSHTHLCYGGSRARDYAMRNAGSSYQEIARAGGGIWDTVRQTRATPDDDLGDRTRNNLERHLHAGVTTVEVKSGYGLSVAEELRQLRSIKSAAEMTAADVVSTCLAAHLPPPDHSGGPAAYLEEIATELFPLLREENLTRRIDAFVEEGAFSPTLLRPYLQRARDAGFDLTLHADQFSTGGGLLAAELGVLSADHLEASGEVDIRALTRAGVVQTALPGATLGLGCAFAPARMILDQGGILAIASDWNPGSGPIGDLLTGAALLGTFQKLSNTEVLAGITFRAAAALGLSDRGRLAPNMLADFQLYHGNDYREITYHQGQLRPVQVWKRGQLVFKA